MFNITKKEKKTIEKYLKNNLITKGKCYVPNVLDYNVWEHVVPNSIELRQKAISLLKKEACTVTPPTQKELRSNMVNIVEYMKEQELFADRRLIERIVFGMEFTQFSKEDEIYKVAYELLRYAHGEGNYKTHIMHLGLLVYEDWYFISDSHLRNCAYDMLIELITKGQMHKLTTYDVVAMANDAEWACSDNVFL